MPAARGRPRRADTLPVQRPVPEVQDRPRCFGSGDPLMAAYHDREWGFPAHDDRLLFEQLILDGFQAGLSWRTILYKRERFREAFDNFDAERVARYSGRDLRRLLADAGIVRNRAKIQAAVTNARAFLHVREEFGSFDRYLWSFTGYRTLQRKRRARSWEQVPSTSPESDALSTDLQARGFRFVGSTICYAFMQSAGLVDDHLAGCFRARPAGSADSPAQQGE